jgi:hypothetical protein
MPLVVRPRSAAIICLQLRWCAFMAGYRCYLMTGENIYGVQHLEGLDDAEVITKAAVLLLSKPEHQSIEIWEGKRMVARVPRHADSGAGQ